MRRRIYLVGIAALSMAAAATGEPLDGLEFLVDTWSAGASDFQGTDVFQLDLDGRILQRHSRSTVPAASGRPAGAMQALLTIYPTGEANQLEALYVDDAGHTIHYDHITVTSGREIELRSDGSPSKPEFRLTYSLTAPGTLHVKFELRPPGQSAYSTLAEADESLKH
jgi:hypothetical protein